MTMRIIHEVNTLIICPCLSLSLFPLLIIRHSSSIRCCCPFPLVSACNSRCVFVLDFRCLLPLVSACNCPCLFLSLFCCPLPLLSIVSPSPHVSTLNSPCLFLPVFRCPHPLVGPLPLAFLCAFIFKSVLICLFVTKYDNPIYI